MKPGPELDALVHEKVMGRCPHDWEHWPRTTMHPDGYRTCKLCKADDRFVQTDIPRYSTNMVAAWLVVEKMRLGGELAVIAALPDGSWSVSYEKALNPRGDGTADDWDHTTPHCRFRTVTPTHGICIGAVDMYLDEDALDEWKIGCFVCDTTHKEGHKPTCFQARFEQEREEL